MSVGFAIAGATLVGGYMTSQASKSAASSAAGASDRANAISDAQFQQTRTDMAPWRNAGSSAIGQLSYLLGLPGYEPRSAAPGGQPGSTQLRTLGSRGPVLSYQDLSGRERAPGMAQQLGMDEVSTGTGNPAGESGDSWLDSISASGGPTPTTYNTQLGDFGSLSRDFGIADFQADPGYEFRLQQGQKALERSASAGGRFLGGGTLKALTRYGQDMGSQEFGRAFDRFNLNRNTRFNQLAAVAGIGQTANGQLAQLGSLNATTQGNNLMGAATVAGNAGMAGAAGWSTALNNGVNNWLTYRQTAPSFGAGQPYGWSGANAGGGVTGNFGTNGAWASTGGR